MTDLTPPDREDIQGIVLSGFGHLLYTSYGLLTITDRAGAKAWLRQVIPEVTTAKPWPQKPDGSTIKPEVTCNLAFTHAGLVAMAWWRRPSTPARESSPKAWPSRSGLRFWGIPGQRSRPMGIRRYQRPPDPRDRAAPRPQPRAP
ncbi:hypothetical protein XM38_048390 [Halomicronema hongdechloris C2206]|uniref:Uncharacterized protein n=1 Tax=Halomicronema hongdechloris C2206 TaxID=1641165 RepID=A0A1Z3HUC1_9CYAN|nr:hypothetical protein [Halomicronema hongdechloris]ASC73865.1 hypothetical protein XM38_048390 [Halomicronema hongdechloris C2206]